MKTYKEISENLAILGIFSKDQLDKHNLDYWWRKKYTQIFESNLEDKNELLINLNNAKDNLNFEESLSTCKYVLKKIKNAETETVLRQDNAGINKTNGNYFYFFP